MNFERIIMEDKLDLRKIMKDQAVQASQDQIQKLSTANLIGEETKVLKKHSTLNLQKFRTSVNFQGILKSIQDNIQQKKQVEIEQKMTIKGSEELKEDAKKSNSNSSIS